MKAANVWDLIVFAVNSLQPALLFTWLIFNALISVLYAGVE